jgi:hypothetical protein
MWFKKTWLTHSKLRLYSFPLAFLQKDYIKTATGVEPGGGAMYQMLGY